MGVWISAETSMDCFSINRKLFIAFDPCVERCTSKCTAFEQPIKIIELARCREVACFFKYLFSNHELMNKRKKRKRKDFTIKMYKSSLFFYYPPSVKTCCSPLNTLRFATPGKSPHRWIRLWLVTLLATFACFTVTVASNSCPADGISFHLRLVLSLRFLTSTEPIRMPSCNSYFDAKTRVVIHCSKTINI